MKNLKRIILALLVTVAFATTTNAATRVKCEKVNNKEILNNFKNKIKKDNTLDLLEKGEKANLVIYGNINSDNTIQINKVNGGSDEIKEHLLSTYNENAINNESELSKGNIVFMLKLIKY